ncbi:MAG: MATE family efflux transporter, partial [Chloroflexota bacterium]
MSEIINQNEQALTVPAGEAGVPVGEGEAPAVLPETPKALRRRVLGMAWPVIGENMLETSLDIVNTLLVAGLGAVALAGVGSGLQIMFFVLAALAALSVGSSVLVAQAVGARNME